MKANFSYQKGHTTLNPTFEERNASLLVHQVATFNCDQRSEPQSVTKNEWGSISDVIVFLSPFLIGDSHYGLQQGFIKFGWEKEISE